MSRRVVPEPTPVARTTITLPVPVVEMLTRRARAEDRSLSSLVRAAIFRVYAPEFEEQ